MSAKYNRQDGYILGKTLKIDAMQEKVINELFDHQCDLDVQDAIAMLKQRKKLLAMAFIRLVLFPMEWSLTRLLVGKSYAKVVAKSGSICYKFVRGNITTEEFIGSVK